MQTLTSCPVFDGPMSKMPRIFDFHQCISFASMFALKFADVTLTSASGYEGRTLNPKP